MHIRCEALPHHLARGLGPLYVIHGEALLLALEAADAIRAAARAAGYTEREVFIAEQHFKWAELKRSAQTPSLFAARKLIDLRIPSGKPGVEGARVLQEYCENLPPDTLTLISLPKLEPTAYKSKWFGALEQHGLVISADEIPLPALPDWISQRLQRQQQSADKETLAFLAQRVEGNLLAALQEIQKLGLLYPPGKLSFEQVSSAVMDVARYDVFDLSAAMLDGDAARFVRILDGLRGEGTAAALILWTLADDLRQLAKTRRALQMGCNLEQALRQARVWGPKKPLVERAVHRFSLNFVQRALQRAAQIDRLIKGLRQGDEWDELLQLGLCCTRAKNL